MKLFGFPAAVFFIVSNEFCERFSYYGMKAILVIYLTMYVKMDANSAVSLTHGFNMICYVTPLLGAILADSYLGKFKTIFYISIIYSIGNAVMAVTAVPAVGGAQLWGPLLGLFLIGLGTGGIKPCVAAFGGDQFSENEEGKLGSFFSLFYFSINAGSVLSMLITPYLRVVPCFDEQTCYSLAFGIPAILMLVAIGIFVLGDLVTKYVKRTPEGNVFGDVCRCIFYALKRKMRAPGDQWRRHWLDWADDRYSPQLINDIKAVLNVFTIFIPLPMFWALFEQQATRWTLQAQRLDGMNVILPDQMGVVNALLILAFIPIFDKGVYPLLNKCGFAMRPLQRVGIGLLLTSASFVVSGFLEVALESQDLHPPAEGFGFVTVINNLDQPIRVEPVRTDVFTTNKIFNVEKHSIMESGRLKVNLHRTQTIHGDNVTDVTYDHPKVTITASGRSWIKELVVPDSLLSAESNFSVFVEGEKKEKMTSMEPLQVDPGYYGFSRSGGEDAANDKKRQNYGNGGTYTVVFKDGSDLDYAVYINTEANKYAIFWQIPQYIIITMGEIMVSITGLSFAYSQAPESMKAVLQSGWLFTTFVGNAVVVIVTEAQHGSESKLKHSEELFLFAGLCFLTTILFMFLAMSYTYVNVSDSVSDPGSISKVSPDMELHEIGNGKVANGSSNPAYEVDD